MSSPDLSAALGSLWTKFLPEMTARLSIIESAAASLAAASLTPSQQHAAASAAHKLAGVLGTFGLAQGTTLARELELIYSRQNAPDSALCARLTAAAAELRALIENRV